MLGLVGTSSKPVSFIPLPLFLIPLLTLSYTIPLAFCFTTDIQLRLKAWMDDHGHNMRECSESLLICLSVLCQWYSDCMFRHPFIFNIHTVLHMGSLVQMHHGSEVGGQGCTLCAFASGEVRGHCALLTLSHFWPYV